MPALLGLGGIMQELVILSFVWVFMMFRLSNSQANLAGTCLFTDVSCSKHHWSGECSLLQGA
jgi:hypothetical protein